MCVSFQSNRVSTEVTTKGPETPDSLLFRLLSWFLTQYKSESRRSFFTKTGKTESLWCCVTTLIYNKNKEGTTSLRLYQINLLVQATSDISIKFVNFNPQNCRHPKNFFGRFWEKSSRETLRVDDFIPLCNFPLSTLYNWQPVGASSYSLYELCKQNKCSCNVLLQSFRIFSFG